MNSNLTTIFGIGVSCLDFICPIEEEFLITEQVGAKGGSYNIGPSALERILVKCRTVSKVIAGGSAANTIRVLARLGEKCNFFSQTGQDTEANDFINDLNQHGITPLITKIANYTTSRVICLITPDGQRTIRGHDQKVSATIDHRLFSNCKLAHFEARRLTSSNYVEEIMQVVKTIGGMVSLDLSSFETVLQHKKTLLDLISNYVDVVFANQDEIIALTQHSVKQGIQALQKMGPTVVVTLGANGALSSDNQTIHHVPAFPAQVVDTTGAGDFFAGGFLYGYLHEYSLQECMLLGNRLAGHCVEAWGPTIDEKHWQSILSRDSSPR